jgi:hypothetical protein
MCIKDGAEELTDLTLNANILYMQMMHFISFILIGWAIYFDSTDLNAH